MSLVLVFPYVMCTFLLIIVVKVPGVNRDDLKQLLDFTHKLRMSSDFTVSYMYMYTCMSCQNSVPSFK